MAKIVAAELGFGCWYVGLWVCRSHPGGTSLAKTTAISFVFLVLEIKVTAMSNAVEVYLTHSADVKIQLQCDQAGVVHVSVITDI